MIPLNDTERELLTLERKYWQAMIDKDVDTVLQLSDETCIFAASHGMRRMTKQKLTEVVQSMPYRIRDVKLGDDVEVRLLNEDTAILVYNIKENLIIKGSPSTLDATDTSTWVRRNGKWLCALHTESITGDSGFIRPTY